MTPDLLYSVNPRIKFTVQKMYFGNLHYVWCADHWDSESTAIDDVTAHVPPSSNPLDIYRELQQAVKRGDTHCAKIVAIRQGYLGRCAEQVEHGIITQQEADQIVSLVSAPDLSQWEPWIYVIHRPKVEKRLALKPHSERAGVGYEYVIPDLRRAEFEIMRGL